MSSPIAINQFTDRRLKDFIARPTHALILAAPTGSGKTTLALWLVGQITNLPSAKLKNFSDLRIISPSGKSISIDEVRELNQFLKLKTTGESQLRRFVIVEQAENLTLEAQNAFLKLFEEPPDDTLIILTVSNPSLLLPTVISRAQVIDVKPVTRGQLDGLFSPKPDNFDTLYALSSGRPGLLTAMVENDQTHPLIEAIDTAKGLLALSKYERLTQIDELTKRRNDHIVLEALQLIASRGLVLAASQGNPKLIKRWQKILKSTYETKIVLQSGAQTKLAFTSLMLNL